MLLWRNQFLKAFNNLVNVNVMTIRIVTDSTSGFPQELAKKENVGIIESKVMLEGKDLKELTEIDSKDLADSIPKLDPYPKTTMASPQEALDVFNQAVEEKFDEILYIGVSPTISNQFNSAKVAAKKVKDKVKVTLYECGLSTTSQGALVFNAVKLVKQGKKVDEVISILDEMKTLTFTIGVSPSFEILFKTGKIQKKASLAVISSLLRLKPLYEIVLDKGAQGCGAGKGFKGAITKAVEKLSESQSKGKEYDLIISDAFNTKFFPLIENETKKEIKIKEVLSWKIPPCVMLSTGVRSFQITLVPHID